MITKWSVIFLGFIIFTSVPYQASGKIPSIQSVFYIASHGSDNNPGTKRLPWKTVKPLNKCKFAPGDTVFFARGSNFKSGFIISSSGKPGRSIVFKAYGKGSTPVFTNPSYDNLNGNAIQVKGSHIVIDGLHFHDGLPANPDKGIRVHKVVLYS